MNHISSSIHCSRGTPHETSSNFLRSARNFLAWNEIHHYGTRSASRDSNQAQTILHFNCSCSGSTPGCAWLCCAATLTCARSSLDCQCLLPLLSRRMCRCCSSICCCNERLGCMPVFRPTCTWVPIRCTMSSSLLPPGKGIYPLGVTQLCS